MKWIESDSLDVFYNLALEEYLFETVKDDCFIIWTNRDAVVIGRNQNIFEEVDVDGAVADGIDLVRRNSGGGAVFHDRGNINFTIIKSFDMNAQDQYDEFLTPMIKMLNSLGIPAARRNKSDIAVGDRKISGNAQMIKAGRIIHHGTLLFNADLKRLKRYLKEESTSYSSRSTKSVRSSVANISEYVDMTADEFKRYMTEYFCTDDEMLVLNNNEKAFIKNQSEKYRSRDWVIGKSPEFTAVKRLCCGSKILEIKLVVAKGIIKEAKAVLNGVETEPEKEAVFKAEYEGREYSEAFVSSVMEKNRRMFT